MDNKKIIKNLKNLRSLEAAGAPRELWLLSNRETLMSQIKPAPAPEYQAAKTDGVYYWQYFSGLFKQKVLQPAVSFISILMLMLTYTAMASVASASLPGDMLYPVQATGEKVSIALTFENDKKLELQMNFVGRRVDELTQLAKKDETTEVKARKISLAVKKLTQDVQSVKDNLDKISVKPEDSKVVEVAKVIDSKTLEVEQNIALVHQQLPEEVKGEVAQDVQKAISTAEEAGTSALGVIVENHNSGENKVSESEVTSRVAERIKNVEQNIAQVQLSALQVSTTTVEIITTGVSAVGTSTVEKIVATTSTIAIIGDKPQQAQEAIEQAKDLLGQKNFNSALEKIKESKEIINNVISDPKIVIPASAIKNTILNSSTSLIITNTQISATTTRTSETTRDLLKK
jgi:hypothetical protein